MQRPTALVLAAALLLAACTSADERTADPTTSSSVATSEPTPTAATSTVTVTSTSAAVPTTVRIGPGDPQLIVLPDANGQLPPTVEVGCRTGPYFPASALASVTPVDDPSHAFVADAIEPFLTSGEGSFWPQTGWQVLHETSDTILIVHIEPTSDQFETTVSLMTIELRGDEWQWAGSRTGGECELTTRHALGLNRVEWRLDPAHSPDPESNLLFVLATELECASGKAMGGRLLPPDVVITDEAVYIAFVALPQEAESHTCQGNPDAQVTIDLMQPLGERPVLDGMRVAGFLSDYIADAA